MSTITGENLCRPLPPFDAGIAAGKAPLAEDAWNSGDPERAALAYTPNSVWRNGAECIGERDAIVGFLTRKWEHELGYRLIEEVWAFRDNRIAVRFVYEWHDHHEQWFRSYGNENGEFDSRGFMRVRIASINDLPIDAANHQYHRPLGRRPDEHASPSDRGL